MKGAKFLPAVLASGALLATAVPASADAAAYSKYVACGKTGKAKPSHSCPTRRGATGNVGAFFRSNNADVFYKVCVALPRRPRPLRPAPGGGQGNPVRQQDHLEHARPSQGHLVRQGKRVGVWFFQLT